MLKTSNDHGTISKPLISNNTFVSSLQFVGTVGNAGWSKFSSLFFLENGVSASQLAIITVIQSIAKFSGYPTFGMMADYFGNSKSLLLLSLVVSNIIVLLFYFPSTKSMIFGNFFLLLFVRGIRSYSNCIWSLIDVVTMKLIADKKSYGKHRLFCSLGWGISSLICGKLIDLYSMDCLFIYGLCWSFITFSLIYFFMPTNTPNYSQHKYEPLSNTDHVLDGEINDTAAENNNENITNTSPKYDFCQIFKLLISLRHDYQFIFCLIIMVIYWNVMFIIERIIFIQMDQDFGATKFMNGFATLCTTIAEVPFFYYSANLMKRFSLNRIYVFCHIVLIIRLLSYLLCTDLSTIWMIYVIQTLHGVNFGLGFTVCRIYLYQLGEIKSNNNELGMNVRATIQSLKGLISMFSMLTGSMIWLPIYDNYSAQTVYIYGSVALLPSIMFLFYQNPSQNKLFNVLK